MKKEYKLVTFCSGDGHLSYKILIKNIYLRIFNFNILWYTRYGKHKSAYLILEDYETWNKQNALDYIKECKINYIANKKTKIKSEQI